MDYIDFTQLHPVKRGFVRIGRGIIGAPKRVSQLFVAIGKIALAFMRGIGQIFSELFHALADGDFKTRASFLVFGAGNLLRGQIAKGLLYLLCQPAYIAYMIGFGIRYVSQLDRKSVV